MPAVSRIAPANAGANRVPIAGPISIMPLARPRFSLGTSVTIEAR